jgi:hypothetical protein
VSETKDNGIRAFDLEKSWKSEPSSNSSALGRRQIRLQASE